MKKTINLLLYFIVLTVTVSAKTFQLSNVNEVTPFCLRIYCTEEGKAAIVLYDGQKGFLPLHPAGAAHAGGRMFMLKKHLNAR